MYKRQASMQVAERDIDYDSVMKEAHLELDHSNKFLTSPKQDLFGRKGIGSKGRYCDYKAPTPKNLIRRRKKSCQYKPLENESRLTADDEVRAAESYGRTSRNFAWYKSKEAYSKSGQSFYTPSPFPGICKRNRKCNGNDC